jgi:hypothetical protein
MSLLGVIREEILTIQAHLSSRTLVNVSQVYSAVLHGLLKRRLS